LLRTGLHDPIIEEAKMWKISIALTVCLVAGLVPRDGRSTAGWLVIDERTVEGTWVALEQQGGEVCRLQIEGREAFLVMTAGPAQSEFVFVSHDLTVKNGRVFGRMEKEPAGMTLDIGGRGRADTLHGFLTLKLTTVNHPFPPWKERTLVFMKESRVGSVVDTLARNDQRARLLMDGAVKARESSVPPANRGKAAAGKQPTKPDGDAGLP
jgi:hypothetical protein